MKSVTNRSQIWLAKKAGVILGPYSTEELMQEIRDRMISPLDEVRTTTKRWAFVREQKELSDILQAIRNEDMSSPQGTSVTMTASLKELTKSITGSVTDELTPIPESIKKNPLNRKSNSVPQPMAAKGKNPSQIYQIQKESQISPLIKFILPAAVLLLIGLYFFDMKKATRVTITQNQLLEMAQRYQSIGLYDKALGLYQRIENLNQLPIHAQSDYLQLLIGSEQKLDVAEKLIQLIANQLSNESKSAAGEGAGRPAEQIERPQAYEIENWKGMLSHLQGKFDIAAQSFSESLKSKPDYQSAALNQFINQTFIVQKGSVSFSELMKNKIQHPLYLLNLSLQILKGYVDISLEQSEILMSEIEKDLLLYPEYKFEYHFMQVALNSFFKKSKDATLSFQKLIEELTLEKHIPVDDLQVLHTSTQWKNMVFICKNVSETFAGTAYQILSQILCETKSERYAEAWTLSELLIRKYPENLEIGGLQSYILVKLKRLPEAKLISAVSKLVLSKLVLTEICYQEKDISCAEKAVQEASQIMPQLPLMRFWNAQVLLSKNNKEMAKQEINKGLGTSSHYYPLIQLKEEIDAH